MSNTKATHTICVWEKDVMYAFHYTGEIQKKAQGFCS
jgi:hypothetical protein